MQTPSTPNAPLLDLLHQAATALSLNAEDPAQQALLQDLETLTNADISSGYRIAVFGPFNFGKSTLLNALLGTKALPMDLIPTTGAAISVSYGPALCSRITLASGEVLEADGIELLEQHARLDDDRRMNDNVTAVEVQCPHALLKNDVIFLDLPGTDDQDAQEKLVREQLLTADLVIQVLDGRKLMTLGEREHLRDWLQDRGIETVLFTVNFLNLLEPTEQKQVMNRMRFVAESFRSALPGGISNLYRVDALPALRAQLKGDAAALQTTGLPALATALETLIQQQESAEAQAATWQTRQQALGKKLEVAVQQKAAALTHEIKAAENNADSKDAKRFAIQQKAQRLIQEGFGQEMSALKTWINPNKLTARYELEAVDALRRFEFETWIVQGLQADLEPLQRNVTDWVAKACTFFDGNIPSDLRLIFPAEPAVNVQSNSSSGSRRIPRPSGLGSTAASAGVGWMLGGPIGAVMVGGTNLLLNSLTDVLGTGRSSTNSTASSRPTELDIDAQYAQAVRRYFQQMSSVGMAAIADYEYRALEIINRPLKQVQPPNTEPQKQERQQLEVLLEQLRKALEAA